VIFLLRVQLLGLHPDVTPSFKGKELYKRIQRGTRKIEMTFSQFKSGGLAYTLDELV
jgi:hypothetical protein